MNKFLLLGAASILSVSASAQTGMKESKAIDISGQYKDISNKPSSLRHNPQPAVTAVGTTANKGAATTTRWYNHAQTLGDYFFIPNIYDQNLFNLFAMWQDSTVRYSDPSSPTGISDRGINYLSIGQVFHPQAETYTDPVLQSNQNLQKVGPNDSYTIDSVEVMGFYSRVAGSNTVDTLIFTMITEQPPGEFFYLSYGGTVLQDHGIDSSAALLWSKSDYGVRALNQVSYSVGGVGLSAPTVYKMPLTAATFADSTADGYHFLAAPMNVSVPAGAKATLSITYKYGGTYTAGSPISDYNYFAYGSHETVGSGFVDYPMNDNNMSSILYKDTTNKTIATNLAYYTPAIAFTAPFAAEVHDISFKVSCNTCALTTGVKNTATNFELGAARPNPAQAEFAVPVTPKVASEVSVLLTNPMGQVVATQNLGKVAAGQTATAVFNTAALANGVYFYTVQAGTERVTNRVVVAH